MTTLVLELTKIENDDESRYTTFYSNSKVEAVINESDIDDIIWINNFIKQLYQTYKNIFEKVLCK